MPRGYEKRMSDKEGRKPLENSIEIILVSNYMYVLCLCNVLCSVNGINVLQKVIASIGKTRAERRGSTSDRPATCLLHIECSVCSI